MGGTTGNIRTLRNQSGTVGSRTLGSILASGNGGGAGSVRRMYAFYKKQNPDVNPFTPIFGINRGQFQDRAQWFIEAIYPGYPDSK
jgi:hypothetical protein